MSYLKKPASSISQQLIILEIKKVIYPGSVILEIFCHIEMRFVSCDPWKLGN